ncbi:MAG TPA: biopolymer transporter ExbD [Anaerohalosphaeraceae bacterium]|nr:biopolymer transporter ExbD [Anaerohalosphaeraceae bacterium]HOL89876.1 biopolymer transporter ExbD [Anaerohalosphaeraceae bacterium]HPP56815.1 biopolymer transporter ExbD [Anaerohalosphaeraceae bacterium]
MHSSEGTRLSFHQRTLEGLTRRSRTDTGLRMAPMIDVIFLLLTFFVLTAKFRRSEAIVPLRVPQNVSSERLQIVEPLILELTLSGGGFRLKIGTDKEMLLSQDASKDEWNAAADAVEEVCRRQQRRADDPVELICGDEVSWDAVVKVYDLLRVLGLNQITFLMTDANEEYAQ